MLLWRWINVPSISVFARKAIGVFSHPYMDGRSIGAKRYQEAIGQTKVEMAVGMIRRTVRAVIKADYIDADAWFGNKRFILPNLC